MCSIFGIASFLILLRFLIIPAYSHMMFLISCFSFSARRVSLEFFLRIFGASNSVCLIFWFGVRFLAT